MNKQYQVTITRKQADVVTRSANPTSDLYYTFFLAKAYAQPHSLEISAYVVADELPVLVELVGMVKVEKVTDL